MPVDLLDGLAEILNALHGLPLVIQIWVMVLITLIVLIVAMTMIKWLFFEK